MVKTTFFKVKLENKLIGVKYTEEYMLSSQLTNFSRTIYLAGESPNDNQEIRRIDLDEFLDICNHYKLLERENNPEPDNISG